MPSPIRKIDIGDKGFPPLLKETPVAPRVIYYLGNLPGPDEVMISIVGTRKATHEGILSAKRIGHDLAQSGITVVSGLALGVDGAAHEGSLAGGGKTIAVLGNGLDSIYPRQHYNLARKIINEGGCIMSEYPEGTPAYPNQFLERNRIVSGLSVALIIIEAPIRSGSLVTAKHALDQGREVFVVPGNISHQNYKGSHMLLRNGARLVTSTKDILEDLGLESQISTNENANLTNTKMSQKNLSAEEKSILGIIESNKKPLDVDKIIEATKLQPQTVNQKLTLLTLEGLVEEKNGKFKVSSKISSQ